MSDWLDSVRSFLQSPEVPGVAGALLSARDAPGQTWGGRLFSIACGLSLAFFVIPFILELLGVESRAGFAAAGFIGGWLGMNLLVRFKDYVMTTPFGDLLRSVVTRKLP